MKHMGAIRFTWTLSLNSAKVSRIKTKKPGEIFADFNKKNEYKIEV